MSEGQEAKGKGQEAKGKRDLTFSLAIRAKAICERCVHTLGACRSCYVFRLFPAARHPARVASQ